MLDLGLEHLGIDIGKAKSGVLAVVTSVGQSTPPLGSIISRVSLLSSITASSRPIVSGTGG